jgi:hypothetical protein
VWTGKKKKKRKFEKSVHCNIYSREEQKQAASAEVGKNVQNSEKSRKKSEKSVSSHIYQIMLLYLSPMWAKVQ